MARGHNLFEFLLAVGVEFLHLGEYLEGMLRVAAEILHRVHESLAAKRSTVGLAVALIAGVIVLAGTLAHDAVPDDE